MIKRYRITNANATKSGLILPANFVVEVIATYKENTPIGYCWKVVIQTTVSDGGLVCDNPEDIATGRVEYAYNPATDNSKDESSLFTDNFEPNLTTWLGAWTSI